MKDFLAWLSCVHLEIRMRNSGLVKSTCFHFSQVFHFRLPGYQLGVWDVGILVNLYISLYSQGWISTRMHQGCLGMFRSVVSHVPYLGLQENR